MAITYPLPKDFWDSFPGWSTGFELFWRREQSRLTGGQTLVKDFGSPLWKMTAASRSLSPNQLDYWRARLDALEDGLKTFRAFPKSRYFPVAYPNGSWPTGAAFSGGCQVASINANRKAIAVGGLPAGFKISVGDYVQIADGDLHRVMEAATAGANGQTPQFEIRPHLWPAITGPIVATIKQPSCVMTLVPGTLASTADPATGRGTISFQAMESR